jgi:hypothetical protein
MRGVFYALVVTVTCGVSGAAAQTMLFADSYIVQGKNPSGKPYSGTATVDVASDTTVKIVWKTGQTYSGFGMRSDNVFAVAYESAGIKGVMIYRHDAATGVFTGKWTVLGRDGVGEETLTPKK